MEYDRATGGDGEIRNDEVAGSNRRIVRILPRNNVRSAREKNRIETINVSRLAHEKSVDFGE